MKWIILRKKKYRLSLQQLDLILKSSSAHTSYTVVKHILNLPFETSEIFLKQYNIHDSFHFFEHVQILFTLKNIIQNIKNNALNLAYPLIMLISSSVLLNVFQSQFKRILVPMNISIPTNVSLILLIHYVLIVLLCLSIIFILWVKQSLYRRVLILSLLKKTRLIKIVYELVLITTIQSVTTSSVSLKEIHILISKHTNHALMRIMANDLNQIIEEGKTMMYWLDNYGSFPTMNKWIYEQISQSNQTNLLLWSDQLQLSLRQTLMHWKNILLSTLYGLIALNIMAMMSLFSLPYEWIHQL